MLKVAIIGTGVMGLTHGKAIKESRTLKLIGFVGRDYEKTKRISDSFEVKSYRDIEEILSKEDIDVVDICIPTYLHEYAVLVAIKYKKHIMCEKPFTLSYNIAKKLTEDAKSAGIKMMVLQVVRFWPEYSYIKELIDKNTLGNVNNVYINRLSTHPKWATWHRDPLKSGGGLYDLNIHDIDYLYYVFGRVKSVYAIGHRSNTGCYNCITTNIIFYNGTTATIECNMDMKGDYPFTTCVRVVGDRATLEYNSTSRYKKKDEKYKCNDLILYKSDKNPSRIDVKQYNPYKKQMEYFAKCILENKEIEIIKMVDVLYVLRIISAIEKSLETNEVITDI